MDGRPDIARTRLAQLSLSAVLFCEPAANKQPMGNKFIVGSNVLAFRVQVSISSSILIDSFGSSIVSSDYREFWSSALGDRPLLLVFGAIGRRRSVD